MCIMKAQNRSKMSNLEKELDKIDEDNNDIEKGSIYSDKKD